METILELIVQYLDLHILMKHGIQHCKVVLTSTPPHHPPCSCRVFEIFYWQSCFSNRPNRVRPTHMWNKIVMQHIFFFMSSEHHSMWNQGCFFFTVGLCESKVLKQDLKGLSIYIFFLFHIICFFRLILLIWLIELAKLMLLKSVNFLCTTLSP